MNIKFIKTFLLDLQEQICQQLAALEPVQTFIEDSWERSQGGGGRTRVLENGEVIERGGVNFSHVHGQQLPASATKRRPDLADSPFQALGISVVLHPKNPYAPTGHMNLRFFQALPAEQSEGVWWFGGGFDLTPYYGFDEDCYHWHHVAESCCRPFGTDVYGRYKRWCDEYFYLRHRDEQRGIGGLFFDDLNEWGFENCFSFVRLVGQGFSQAYMPILKRRKDHAYGDRERQFQLYRRSRYVEFNLVHDRGTIFGLQSGGRTESILVSMPPVVNWCYNWQPKANTREAELYERYLTPKDWLYFSA